MLITLDAGETQNITIAGAQFYLLSTSAGDKVRVKIVSGGDSRSFELSPGMGFKDLPGERWYGLEIENLSAYEQDIEFEVSDREVFDNRVTFSSSGEALPVETKVSTKITAKLYTCTGVTGTSSELVLASNSNRKRAVLQFDASCRITGDADMAGAVGQHFPVPAGYEFETSSTSGIKAFQTLAGDQVHIIEEVYI